MTDSAAGNTTADQPSTRVETRRVKHDVTPLVWMSSTMSATLVLVAANGRLPG